MLRTLLQDNATNCSDAMAPLNRYFLPAAYGLIFAVGLVGNVTAISVYVAVLRPWKSGSIIMVNLALADLLYMLTLPFLVHYYTNGEAWSMGPLLCCLVRFAFHLNLYSSVLLLTCLTAFRWLAVARPLRAAQVRRRSWGLAACAAAWAAAVAGVGPMLGLLSATEVADGGGVRTACLDFASSTPREAVALYSWLLTALGFLLPLAVVAGCNAGIVWELARGPYTGSPCRARARRLTVAILAVFVVCFLPYHVLRVLRVTTLLAPEDWSCAARRGIHAAYIVSRPLAAVNTLCNLALYTLAGERFHRAVLRIVSTGRRRSGSPLGPVHAPKTAANGRRSYVVDKAIR
ncbi:unnamed protein product [Lota lota]